MTASARGLLLAALLLAGMAAAAAPPAPKLLRIASERETGFDPARPTVPPPLAGMPYKRRTHPMQTALWHPHRVGYRRPLFWNQWFDTVDIEPALDPR